MPLSKGNIGIIPAAVLFLSAARVNIAFAIFAILMLTASTAEALPRTASVSGDWDDTATWGGLSVPVAGDTVTVNSGITVTVPSGYAAQCATITFAAGTTATSSITLFDNTASLAASGAVAIPLPGAGGLNQIDVGDGIFSAASVALQATTGGTMLSQILISTGTVTVSGNITSAGTDSRITFSGAGTLNAGGTFLSGTAGTFTASTGTVNYSLAGAQTVGAYTYNNLTLSGSGAKTTTGVTVNGVLSMQGTATASVVPTYGAAATLRYNTATARTAGVEWLTPFAATGGVIIDNTGTITLSAAKVFNASVPLTINSGAKLATGNFQLTFGGDFVNNGGTFTGGSAPIVITNTMTTQSIAGFTTTGAVSMTKTAGTAIFTGNVNASTLTINGTGGTLNLGAGLTHTFTGTWTRTNGTLDAESSTLKIGGSISGTGGTFTAGTSSVVLQGATAATISGSNTFNNFSCTTPGKSILVTAGTTQTIGGQFLIDGSAVGTRISLSSTTAGTIWNLVLNGSYSCQYVAVRDSNASSGTVSLPIDPAGFLDNGNNTNWAPTARRASVSGDWNNKATWGGAEVPGAADSVTISSGITVTVPSGYAAQCATINFTANLNASIVLADSTASLAASGAVTMLRPSANGNTNLINVGAGTFSAGSVSLLGTTGTRVSLIRISTGTVTVSGNITSSGTASQIVFSGAGTLNAGGTLLSGTAGTFTASTSTVNYNLAGAQTVGAYTYNILNLSGSGTKTLAGATTANGNLTIGADVTLDTNAASSFALTLGGDLTSSGTFTANASAITIKGTVAQSIAGFTTTGTVSMTKTGGTATFQDNVNGGAFTINGAGGTLNLGTGLTHTFTGAWTRTNGTLNCGSSTLKIGGSLSGTGGTFTAGTGTVEWYAAGAQTIGGLTYNNLVLSGSGTKTLSAATVVSGNLSIDNSVTLDTRAASNYALTLGGDFANSGTFTANASAITITGIKDQSIDGFTTTGLVSMTKTGGTATFQGSVGGAGLTISGLGGTLNLGTGLTHTFTSTWTRTNGTLNCSSSTLKIGGSVSGTGGTFTAGAGTVEWNAAGAQTLAAVTYNNLILSGGGVKTLTGITVNGDLSLSGTATATAVSTTIGGNLTVGAGTTFTVGNVVFRVNGTTSVTGTLTHNNAGSLKTYTGDVTVNNGGIWNETANTAINFGGNLQNDGTFTGSTGVHTFAGDSKTISGAGAILIPRTTISGTYTNNGTLTVSTALAGAGTLMQGVNATLNIGGTSLITGLSANANVNTVDYTGTAQTVKAVTYSNLSLSGSLAKTMTDVTVNGILSMQGTATASVAPTYGANATLRYNTATARTAGVEWITPFAAAGGVIIDNTGTITMNADKVFTSVPLTIISGATLNTDAANNRSLSIDNLVNDGTLTANGSTVTLSGDWTGAGTFNAGTSTVVLSGAGAQSIPGVTCNNLTLSSSGLKTISGITVNGILSMEGTATASATPAPTFGAAATLQYKGTGSQTTGAEFPAAFSGSGGVIIANTSGNAVTLGDAGAVSAPLTINANAILDTSSSGNYGLAFGDFTNNGTFAANASIITANGNWINNGTFTSGSSTVNFAGSVAQTIQTGGSSWNILKVSNASVGGVSFTDAFTTAQLSCTTPGATLYFKVNASSADNYIVTASNGLYITGAAGNNIKLRRYGGVAGDYWVIDPSASNGLWTVDYVDVADSANIAANPIYPSNFLDSGNTLNWFAADANANLIPDVWELFYYRGITHLALEDTDNDGLNTLHEFLFGTDPTQSQGAGGTIWVDASAPYAGDGSSENPYKYLQDAIDVAGNKVIIRLKEGTYTLYAANVAKDLTIRGEDPIKTIIKGPPPYETPPSDTGQMLNMGPNVAFSLSNCTVTLYGDEQPIVSYDVTKNNISIIFERVIFTGNDTGSKPLIAPNAGTQKNTSVYIYNCLFYGNTAAYEAELKGKPLYCFNNTVVDNIGGGLLTSGTGDSFLKNNIVRGNSGAPITMNAPGMVTCCNVEGGFAGAGNFDQAENYIDQARGNYRLVTGSYGIGKGTATFVSNDISGFNRPVAAPDVGAYEYQPTDTDGDGLLSGTDTNDNNPDTDGDGLGDYDEVNVYTTDPTNMHSDGDGIDDGEEIQIGLLPKTFDGKMKNGEPVTLYNESFESDTDYPVGPFSGSYWGLLATYTGDIQIENVGTEAYDGSKVITLNKSHGPRSTITTFVERNNLSEWWIAISIKYPATYAKLPTNVNEALNIGGIYFAMDSLGQLCVYNGSTEQWMAYTAVQVPVGTWFRVYVRRYHDAKTADIYIEINKSGIYLSPDYFKNVPISGVELSDFIRLSFTSLQEHDVQIDHLNGYPDYNPPFTP